MELDGVDAAIEDGTAPVMDGGVLGGPGGRCLGGWSWCRVSVVRTVDVRVRVNHRGPEGRSRADGIRDVGRW